MGNNDLALANAGLVSLPHSIPLYSSFNEAMRAIKPTGRFAPTVLEATPKTLKDLWAAYNKLNVEYLKKTKEFEQIKQEMAVVWGEIREAKAAIRRAKDEKNAALDTQSVDGIHAANGKLEVLGYQAAKLQERLEPLIEKQKENNADIVFFREKIILPKRFFLRAVLEDLKARIISKTEKELRTIVAIGEMIPGEVRLGNIFNDIDFGKIDAGVIVNEVIQTYAKEFQKEGVINEAIIG